MRRLSAFGVIALVIAVSFPGTAGAGGSWLDPIEENIQPGDVVTMVGFSGFGPRQDPTVGPDDPFYAYLEVDRSRRVDTERWPSIHDGMVNVGRISVTRTGDAGYRAFALHVTFRVPNELEPGVYQVTHCNDPCTTNFGEMIGGVLLVGDPPNEKIAADLEIPLADLHGDRWQPPQASLNDPFVAELVTAEQLALTGRSWSLAAVGLVMCLVGLAAVARSRAGRGGRPGWSYSDFRS